MLVEKTEVTKAQKRRQRERCRQFAAGAADALGASGDCLFSLLPYEERLRQTEGWYGACAEAMLHGNYAPLDEWIRIQARMAAQQHFELEDLLKLLRICRRSAIETDGWDEDVFSAVDDVINVGLAAIRSTVSWNIPKDLNYLKIAAGEPAPPNPEKTEPPSREEFPGGERRVSWRNRLALPIRVRCIRQMGGSDETTRTANVSLSGLYFITRTDYELGAALRVTYPYWTDPGSINREYPAQVTRLDRLPDRTWGVAVEFLQNLREKPE